MEKRLADDQNLILTGTSGSGKTKQAKALEKILKRPLIDIDAEIVKSAGKEIKDIFADEKLGERHFRNLEAELLRKAVKLKGHIIVPGAGAVCRKENRVVMRTGGLVLWIAPDIAIIQARLAKKKDRPLATNPKAIEERFWERYSLYQDVAHIRVGIEEERPAKEITELILYELGLK